MSRDVTLRHTGQDVESYLINTVAAADGLIVTLLISIVAELSRSPSPSCRAGNIHQGQISHRHRDLPSQAVRE